MGGQEPNHLVVREFLTTARGWKGRFLLHAVLCVLAQIRYTIVMAAGGGISLLELLVTRVTLLIAIVSKIGRR